MLLVCWISNIAAAPPADANISGNCPQTCGNVLVPYPFGFRDTSALRLLISQHVHVHVPCNSTYSPPRLYFDTGMHIENLSVEEGTISVRTNEAFDCYNKSGKARSSDQIIRLREGPFRFSDTRNKFTAVGCDALAFMTDAEGTFLSDIDECMEPQKYPCKGSCKNTIGNYTCRCPLGMHGDGKSGCQGFRITTIATVLGAVMFVSIISVLIVIIWKKRIKEKNFLENGELAKRCLSNSGVNRPTMKDVTEELGRLMKLHQSLWAQQNSKETENLLGDDSSSYLPIEIETTKMKQPDTYTLNMTTFDF
ncbi:hypothetical protein GH714_012697 [Hevea brasiliensis]|uniref:EGF-like domain-containing protein n=1 Tax=Hevea brasiliensis TaxID=3981 RepID=A0A6A6NAM6_HEVBR|nr:hypothetical protein GH714_012697 [Hevea brasiliensis]